MTSALAPDTVLSAAAGGAVVAFTPPSAGGSFNHSSNRKNDEGVIIENKNAELSVTLQTFHK